MPDKTREDFETWATQFNPQLLINFGRGPTLHGQMAYAAYQAATQHSAARIAELEAEVQALRRGAERYRYLTRTMGELCVTIADENTGPVLKAEAADSAIDAAIEAERAKP